MALNENKRCSVKCCNSSSSKKNLSFFGYPKEIERRKIWIKNCHTEHLANSLSKSNISYRICEKHFEDKMFLNSSTKCRLVFNAIPTLFNFDVEEDLVTNMSTSHISCANLGSNFSFSVVFVENTASTSTVDSNNQTPGYLSAKTPRKKKMSISLKRPKLRDNVIPIQTEPPDIVELSPDTIFESNLTQIEDLSRSPNTVDYKSPKTCSIISNIQNDHCYIVINDHSRPQINDHCYNLINDDNGPQKNVTNNQLKNSLSNKALLPSKKTKVYCNNLTDGESELQKNVTHDRLENNLSTKTLPPSKGSKVHQIKPFQEIINNVNSLRIPSKWHRDISRANTKMVVAFYKLGSYKENYMRFIEKQFVLTEEFQLFLYVFDKQIEISDIGYPLDMQIKTCEVLENIIVKFDRVQICYGSMPSHLNDTESHGYQSVESFGMWRHAKCSVILTEDFSRKKNICVWCKRLCYTIKQRRLREKNNKSTRVSYSPSQRKHIQEIKKVKKLLQKKCIRAAKRIDYLQNNLNSIKEQMKEMTKLKNKPFHNANLTYDS